MAEEQDSSKAEPKGESSAEGRKGDTTVTCSGESARPVESFVAWGYRDDAWKHGRDRIVRPRRVDEVTDLRSQSGAWLPAWPNRRRWNPSCLAALEVQTLPDC
jgi:hypothetical protein